MTYAILLNIFVCWTVAGMGIITASHILRLKKVDSGDKSFGLFWLFSSLLWFFSGLRLCFLYFGFPKVDIALFYVVQIFLALHLVAGVFFYNYKLLRRLKIINLTGYVMGSLSVLFLFFTFFFGITNTTVTPWASDHELPFTAFMFFIPVYCYCLIMGLWAIIRCITRALMRAKLDRQALFAFVALLVYQLAGIIDVKGNVADYRLLLIRSLYMISALVSYLSYTWESSSVYLVTAEELKNK